MSVAEMMICQVPCCFAAKAPLLPTSTRPELHLDIASPEATWLPLHAMRCLPAVEAARALLDLVYGLGTEYNISSDAVHA